MTADDRLAPFLDPSPLSPARQLHGILTAKPLGNRWSWRAVSLLEVLGRSLQELERQGQARFDVATTRAFCDLGRGVAAALAPQGSFILVDEVGAPAWEEMRSRQGVTELYLRALRGDLSEQVLEKLHGFMGTMEGFDIQLALAGREQDALCIAQHGLAAELIVQPLARLEDDLRLGALPIPELKGRLVSWILRLPR